MKYMKKCDYPRYIIGIDEVGRGPIAGPVTVCAVMVTRAKYTHITKALSKAGIKDSKKLSAPKRDHMFSILKSFKDLGKIQYVVRSVSAKIIDKKGIRYALVLATQRCLEKLGALRDPHDYQILLDGSLYAPDVFMNQQTVIKGDTIHPIISAASIIAKETRDAKMRRYAKREKYKNYGFDRHVGYGTKEHYRAIKKFGMSDLHRKSWIKKFDK